MSGPKFERGDLVLFRLCADGFSVRRVRLRIVAKVDDARLRQVLDRRRVWYLAEAIPGMTPPEGRVLTFWKNMTPALAGIPLEWGDLPSEPIAVPADELEPAVTDFEAATWKRQGRCPSCGDAGFWRALALFCSHGHGRFL